MRDTSQYTNIYTTPHKEIMILKEGGSYSFLQEDFTDDKSGERSFLEVIVPAEALEKAMQDVPTSGNHSTIERMQLLFGSYEGLANFQSFCDEHDIDTMTLCWD